MVKKISLIFFIFHFLFSVFLIPSRCSAQENIIAIKAGKIITVTGKDIINGIILIRDGKIAQVGTDVKIPAGAKVIDATNKVVIPGLVDASTTLVDGRSDDSESVSPDLMAKDGFDFFDRYRAILAGGVTTVYVSPGQKRLISGQGFVVKLAGDSIERRILSENSDMMINIGEASKNPPAIFTPPIPPSFDNPILPAKKQFPLTRMGEFAILRGILTEAKIYQRASSDFEQKKGERSPLSCEMEVIRKILNRQMPIRVNCHTAADILKTIGLAKEFRLDLILENATEAYKVAEEISQRKIPVILNGIVKPGKLQPGDNTRDNANGVQKLENAATLANAGVKIAIRAPSDAEISDLQLIAGYALRYGLNPEDALRAITINAAEILGVSSRVGSIAVGKDADLVILNAEPFDVRAFPEATLIDGKIVYKRSGTDLEFYPIEKGKEIPENLVVIKAGKILTVTQGQIDDGIVIIKGSKIIYVGKEISIPPGAKIIDASKSVVMPGMIDIHTHVGLHAESGHGTSPPSVTQGSFRASTRIINAIVPQDEVFQEILSAGITSVLVSPGDSSLVTGQPALIKLYGDNIEEMVIKEPAGVKFSISRDSLGRDSRIAQLWKLRGLLKKGKDYSEKWDKYEKESGPNHRIRVVNGKRLMIDGGQRLTIKHISPSPYPSRDANEKKSKKEKREPEKPKKDENLEPFRKLFHHEIPALVRIIRADEIVNALKLFKDEFGLDVILIQGDDGYRVAEEIRKRGVAIAVGPNIIRRERGRVINNAAVLSNAGVKIAFQTSAASGAKYLPLSVAWAVRYGMNPVEALKAVTISPAEMLKVADRLGSIEKGKDADLVIMSGGPFDLTSRVEKVIINGQVVFESK